jgi:hypothetical protein
MATQANLETVLRLIFIYIISQVEHIFYVHETMTQTRRAPFASACSYTLDFISGFVPRRSSLLPTAEADAANLNYASGPELSPAHQ